MSTQNFYNWYQVSVSPYPIFPNSSGVFTLMYLFSSTFSSWKRPVEQPHNKRCVWIKLDKIGIWAEAFNHSSSLGVPIHSLPVFHSTLVNAFSLLGSPFRVPWIWEASWTGKQFFFLLIESSFRPALRVGVFSDRNFIQKRMVYGLPWQSLCLCVCTVSFIHEHWILNKQLSSA